MDLKLAVKTDVEDINRPLTEQHVNMRNDLVRAAHGLNLQEKRVISICLAKLDSIRAKPHGLNQFVFKISAHEYAEAFELEHSTSYTQLRDAADSLLKRVVSVPIATRGKKEAYKKYQWVSLAEYHESDGWVSIAFHSEMTDKLTFLRGQFTSYKLKHASSLRSVYAWRLLELLMQFKSTGKVFISFDEFCTAMEAPPSCAKDYGQLRRRIIEPAVAELRTKNNLVIDWKGIKYGGRKISALEFDFRPDPQETLFDSDIDN
jgi:plasmid replication initiation protein